MKSALYPYSALVVDRYPEHTKLTRLLLSSMGLGNLREATTPSKGWKIFQELGPDICLLTLPDDANHDQPILELAEQIRNASSETILIILADHFHEDTYQQILPFRPDAFLSKELSLLKLRQAIELALLRQQRLSEESSLSSEGPNRCPASIFLKVKDVFRVMPLETIDFFFSENKLTYAQVGTHRFPTHEQLKFLEKKLNPCFVRIHRSYLANLNRIEQVLPTKQTLIIGDRELPIGTSYRKGFLSRLYLLK